MTYPQDPHGGPQSGGEGWGAPQQGGQGWGGQPQQPWGQQPQDGGGWGAPPPQQQQPGWNQQPGWQGQPQYGPPQAQWDQQGKPGRSGGGRGRWIAVGAVAIVLIGGGVATYAAVSSSDSGASGGSSTPQKAISAMIGDLNNSDLVGALNDLVPSERTAITQPLLTAVDSLKKNDVLKPDADLNHLSGVTFKLTDPTYGSTININDHVQVVELTGGTLTVGANASELPLTSDLLQAVHADSAPAGTETINLAQQIKKDGQPIRLATEKSGSNWYPSLLYTIADNVVTTNHLQAPTAADRIPDAGGSSPDDAVRSLVDDLLKGDVSAAIGLASPDELGVLHDYGKLIVDRVHYSAPPVQIGNLQFTDTSVAGGTQVALKSLTVDANGEHISVVEDGGCSTTTINGQSRKLCGADVITGLVSDGQLDLTADQSAALKDLFSGVNNVGIVVTQTDGKYYVNPIRSYLSLADDLLGGLKGNDGQTLIKLLASH